MPTHLKNYLDTLNQTSSVAVSSIEATVKDIVPKHIESFSHREHIKGLLLGQVQSGKTGQIFGLIAAAADVDEGFNVFVLLTSDISALQQQTYKRALAFMDTFNICDEHDELRFREIGTRKPSIIVLKKNSRILKKWRDILSSSKMCVGRPIFIVDDEADAASLNTKVNKKELSAINTHLRGMLKVSTSSFYLQVTATPQSLFLQSESSGWKPSFVHYFSPGKNYLGGDFFYSKPKPFTNRITEDDELLTLLNETGIAEGLKTAIETYLVTSAHLILSNDSQVCNFLVHPSVKIDDHETIKEKVAEYVTFIFSSLDKSQIKDRLKSAWNDLQSSKPQIKDFGEVMLFLQSKPEIKVITINSGPSGNSRLTYDEGLNIIIGGNSLGRGVTFKCLQTVYYCRSSKSPQADTFWQHCRMFGYDRDPLLMRVFMPVPLFNMFSEINEANEILIREIQENRFDEIQIVTTGKIKPTRKNVIDQNKYDYLVGGVNYFPPRPDEENVVILDEIMNQFDDSKPMIDISIDEAIKIVKVLKSDPGNNWEIDVFVNALIATKSQKNYPNLAKLIVRRGRNIRKGTGTLLSPDDRRLGTDIENLAVLTLYRIDGIKEKGWKGKPFWIPNIKLPKGKVFHRVT